MQSRQVSDLPSQLKKFYSVFQHRNNSQQTEHISESSELIQRKVEIIYKIYFNETREKKKPKA